MYIYKICQQAEWAHVKGVYTGSAKDKEDGFIHFSTAEQVQGTLNKYYAGADDLVLLAIDPAPLGEKLRFEPSRDGAQFPHLYAPLPLSTVRWARPIRRKADGSFELPEDCK